MPGPVQTMLAASVRIAEEPDVVFPPALAAALREWLAAAAGRENDYLASAAAHREADTGPEPGDEADAALRVARVVLDAPPTSSRFGSGRAAGRGQRGP